MKSVNDLRQLRDKLLDAAASLLDDADVDARAGRDTRSQCGVAMARKDMAYTIDTIAAKQAEAEARQARRVMT